MGKGIEEVQAWPASVLAEWRAHFELQAEDRENPPVDEEELQRKLEHTLKPRTLH